MTHEPDSTVVPFPARLLTGALLLTGIMLAALARREALLFIGALAVCIGLFLSTWISVLRRLNHWRNVQSASLDALTRAQEALHQQTTDVTDSKRAEAALLESEARNKTIVQSALDCIIMIDHQGKILEFNPAAERTFGHARAAVLGRELAEVVIPPSMREQHRQGLARFLATGRSRILGTRIELMAIRSDGTEFPIELAITRLNTEGPPTFTGFIRDISEGIRAAAELERVHMELLEASRQAGMAEVATGVLHNVGNVLNSVNIASSCVAESLRNSKAAGLSRVVALLGEHETDLGDFLTHDPKGRQVPVYLAQLAEHLASQQADALNELAQLQKHIEHIKDIVTMQQGLAKGSDVKELVDVSDLVEDALRMDLSGLARQEIAVVKEFTETPPLTVEKHKVLQILVNLVRNAKQACEASDREDRRLTIRTTHGDDRVRIVVCDNGVGILPDHLVRLFSHGFTTKKDGHGFGLHSGAQAAREMGGALTVHSDGLGQGAAFTLELPCRIQEDSHL